MNHGRTLLRMYSVCLLRNNNLQICSPPSSNASPSPPPLRMAGIGSGMGHYTNMGNVVNPWQDLIGQ